MYHSPIGVNRLGSLKGLGDQIYLRHSKESQIFWVLFGLICKTLLFPKQILFNTNTTHSQPVRTDWAILKGLGEQIFLSLFEKRNGFIEKCSSYFLGNLWGKLDKFLV